jgi:hypothetical protein
MTKIRYVLPVIAWVLLHASPVSATEPLGLYNTIARYEFSLAGIGFGKIAIGTNETDSTYDSRLLVKSRGVASLFVKHSSDTKLQGARTQTGYIPHLYETNFQTRNKKKYIKLEYDAKGNIGKETSVPEDTDRPKVPTDQKLGAHDPLSLLFEIRKKLYDALANSQKTFSVSMYDGRRLSRIQVDVIDIVTREVAGQKQRLIHVATSRAPIAGYTEKELLRMKDSPQTLQVYFSDDANLWPMLMEVNVFMATLRGEWVKNCDTIDACF